MSARTHEGRTLRLLTLLDEYTRECLAIRAVLLEHGGKFFLSSIDDQEGWRTRAYFLCQLPNLVMSVDEVFDLLIPQQVQSAKVGGIAVRSQCNIFLRFPPAHLATPCQETVTRLSPSRHQNEQLASVYSRRQVT